MSGEECMLAPILQFLTFERLTRDMTLNQLNAFARTQMWWGIMLVAGAFLVFGIITLIDRFVTRKPEQRPVAHRGAP